MNKRNIGHEILQGIQDIKAWKRGEKKLKTTELNMPTAKDVPIIRIRLGLSQQAFAAFMGVSVATLRNWEQGRREPHGPARTLLLIVDTVPDAFEKAFHLAQTSKYTVQHRTREYILNSHCKIVPDKWTLADALCPPKL